MSWYIVVVEDPINTYYNGSHKIQAETKEEAVEIVRQILTEQGMSEKIWNKDIGISEIYYCGTNEPIKVMNE